MDSGIVIFWEWVDNRNRGVMSEALADLEKAQRIKVEERLDRIEELKTLSHESIKPWADNFSGPLKKIKIHGNVQVRPILVVGPIDKESEITFLLVAFEKDRKLIPANAAEIAEERLDQILKDPRRRRIYDRD